jgi:uncharacterized membrane protein
MKNLLFALFAILCIIGLTQTACKHEPPDVYFPNNPTGNGSGNGTNAGFDSSGWKCSPDTAYFVNDVLPIFTSKCATSGCHDAITREDGYQLTDYANIMRKGISTGNAANSKIYKSLFGNGADLMPPPNTGITLTAAEKELVGKWINQGAKNNACNTNYGKCDTTANNTKFSTYIMPLVNKHCNGCHNNAATGGNILLRNYAEVKASVNTGGFYGSIAWAAGFSRMPKATNQLSTCDVSKINAWIKRGAPNN